MALPIPRVCCKVKMSIHRKAGVTGSDLRSLWEMKTILRSTEYCLSVVFRALKQLVGEELLPLLHDRVSPLRMMMMWVCINVDGATFE